MGFNVIHHLVRTDQKTRCAQHGTFDACRNTIREISLRSTTQGTIRNAEITASQGIIDHFAHFHDATRISARLAIDFNAKYDVIIFQPFCILGTADFRIICRRNTITNFVGRIVLPVINQHSTPRDMTPIDITFDKDFVPPRHNTGENCTLCLKIIGRCRNVPCNQMISDNTPNIDGRHALAQKLGGCILQNTIKLRTVCKAHHVSNQPGKARIL